MSTSYRCLFHVVILIIPSIEIQVDSKLKNGLQATKIRRSTTKDVQSLLIHKRIDFLHDFAAELRK